MKLRTWKPRLLSMLLCLILLIAAVPATLYAADTYQPERKGSITVKLMELGTPKSGTSFAIYQIGKVTGENTLGFELTTAFQGTGIDLNTLQHVSDQIAAAKTCMNHLPATPLQEKASGADGNFGFTNLDHGVYLICQTAQASYGKVEPFLLFLPYTNETQDGWIYDITSSPKGENTKTGAEILKTDESGNPLAGARLALYDAQENLIEEWTSTTQAHVFDNALETNAEYTLKEIQAPEGYLLAANITFQTKSGQERIEVVMADKKGDERYSVKITKYVKFEDKYKAITYSFYAALFWDKECTQRASEVVELKLSKNYCTTAEIKGLAPGTYYVAETNQDGSLMDVTSEAAMVTNEISNQVIELTPQAATAKTNIINHLRMPDDYLYEGKIQIDKQVVAGSEETKVTDTFYFTVYSDEELENIIQTKELSLKNQSSGTVIFDHMAYGSYYIAETDAEGILVDEDFKYAVSIDQEYVTLAEGADIITVTVRNDLGEEEPEPDTDETEPETKKDDVTKPKPANPTSTITRTSSAKTGDSSPILLYTFILLAAGFVVVAASQKYRKNKK